MNARTKVGLMIMAAVIAGSAVIVNLGDVPLFKKGYRFNVIFEDVSDLPHRAIVKIAGVEVGRVSAVELENGQASVSVWVDSRYPIYKNSRARILRMGLIGNTYLSFTVGSSDYPQVEDGDTIFGESPIVYEELVEEVAKRAVEAVNSAIEIISEVRLPENLGENLGETLSSLRRTVSGLERALGPEGERLAGALDNINLLIMTLGPDIGEMTESVSAAAEAVEDLEEIINMLREGRGTAGMLLSSEEVEGQVREAIENILAASDGLSRAVDRYGGFKSSLGARMYYDTTDEEFRSSSFLTLKNSSDRRYLSVGLENIRPDGDAPAPDDRNNTLTLLAGKDIGRFSVFGGAIRSSAGAGGVMRLTDSIELGTEVFDFTRPSPWLNLNARVRLADFLRLGVSYENLLDESRLRGGVEIDIR